MSTLNGKTALVTGGSRGLGREMVMALDAAGAEVYTIARNAEGLEQLKRELKNVKTMLGDVTDPNVASEALCEIQPDILVLNAGATPLVAPISQLSWDEFNGSWETDVKAAFYFGKQAILTPLKAGSTVIIISSGAALSGTPLSGSYAGAKRTQWFMAQAFQQESDRLKLGIRFKVLVPRQLVPGTGLGDNAAAKFAAIQGITPQAVLERMGTPLLMPEKVAESVVALLTDDAYNEGLAFNLTSKELSVMS